MSLKGKTSYRIAYALSILLPIVMIAGNISVFNVRIAGFVMTSYRCLIPVLFGVLMVWIYTSNSRTLSTEFEFRQHKHLLLTSGVLVVWLVYGACTLVVSEYSDINLGIKEMLVIALSGLCVICCSILCSKGGWQGVLTGVRIMTAVAICIGFIELATGMHLATSRYSDPNYWAFLSESAGQSVEPYKVYLATSIFYNENDFSAFLAIMLPVFLADIIADKKWKKIVGVAFTILVLLLLYHNDAFICWIAAIIGIVVFVICARPGIINSLTILFSVVVARIIVATLNAALPGVDSAPPLEASLTNQYANMEAGYGSMYLRINTYKVTLRETFQTSNGLGFGAGSYPNYFSSFVEKEHIMSNPHCYWFEILSEYGVIVFALFVLLLIILFVMAIKCLRGVNRLNAAMIIGMGTAFVLAAVAPSSYLLQTYYWIPIGLAVYLADSHSKFVAGEVEVESNHS